MPEDRAKMAEEIENFLMDKFSNGLKDGSSKVPLRRQFMELEKLLKKKMESPLPPNERKDLRDMLYELNNILTECRMSSSQKILSIDRRPWFLKNTKTTLNQKIEELGKQNGTPGASNHAISSRPNDVAGDSNQAPSSHPNDVAGASNQAPSSHPNDVAVASNPATSSQPTDDVARLPEKIEYSRWSSRSVDTSKVHGLDDGLISVERMLSRRKAEDSFKAIGIVGMSGIGKTTLAQLIFNKKEVKDRFLPRIWVCISKQPNDDEDPKVELVKRMLVCLGVEEEIIESVRKNHDLKGLLYALQLQLKGKRYLIVLDDAWDTYKAGWYKDLDSWSKDEEWGKQLAFGLPKGNGGTVIVTSRNEELAEDMVGKEDIYRVLPLSDPENWWSIFKDQLPKDISESNRKKLEEEFRHKCAGLPLAAKVMGQIMNEEIQKQLAAQTNQVNQS